MKFDALPSGLSARLPMTGPALWRGTLLVMLFGLASILGLVPVLLGADSILSVAVVIVFISACVLYVFNVIAAIQGRKWALMLFLAISCFLIDAAFRQREATAQTIDAQTLMKLIVWGSSMLIAVMATPNFFRYLFHADMKWITLIALYALFSSTYSLTPAYTFGGGVAAIAYCALAVCVTENLRKEKILEGFLAGLTLLLAVSLLMYLAGLGMTVLEGGNVLRLAGIAGSPNSLGRAASLTLLLIGVLLIYGEFSVWNWRCWFPALLAVLCLVLSDSRTSMAVVIVAFALYFVRKKPTMALVGSLLCGALALLILNLDISLHEIGAVFSRTGRSSDLTTLTGRTDIWAASINAFWSKPIFGYGFGSTKVLLPEIYRTYWGFTVTHAHNLYIQTAVTLGLVGLLLVLVIIYRQIVAYVKHQDVFKTVVLGFVLVHGLTEPGPISVSPNIVTFFWALSLCWDRVLERESNTSINTVVAPKVSQI